MLLRFERRLLLLLAVAAIAGLLLLSAGLVWSSDRDHDTCRETVRELYLSHTAFFPAGTPLRHPEGVHLGVDLRHSPFLPDQYDRRPR